MTSAASLYSSLPLVSDGVIRVLDVEPGIGPRISLTLRVVDLDSQPQYEALSYTWGTQVETKIVKVNVEIDLAIRDKLYYALRAMRERNTTRPLWVDAICINQADTDERNQQVSLMGRIYRGAVCVNLWLGRLKHAACYPLEVSSRIYRWLFRTHYIPLYMWEQFAKLPSLIVGRAIVSVLNKCDSLWHERVWTIQEFIMAQELYLHLGRHRLLLDEDVAFNLFQISGGYSKISSLLVGSTEKCKRYDSFINHIHFRLFDIKANVDRELGVYAGAREDNGPKFLQILNAVANTHAKEPSDKIFGVLNILPSAAAKIIAVHYHLPVEEIYATATYAWIYCHGNFRVLLTKRCRDIGSKWTKLPSWVVDFNSMDSAWKEAWIGEWQNEATYPAVQTSLLSQLQQLTLHETFVEIVIDCLTFNIFDVRDDPRLLNELGAFVHGAADVAQSHACNDILTQNDVDEVGKGAVHLTPSIKSLEKRPTAMQLAGLAILSAIHDFWPKAEGPATHTEWDRVGLRSWSHHTFLESGMGVWSDCLGLSLVDRGPSRLVQGMTGGLVEFSDYAWCISQKVTILSTSTGLFGFAPHTIAPGDIIAYVPNIFPFMILRPNGGTHEFRGLAYVHHAMTKELWKSFDMSKMPKSTIHIQ